MQKPKHPEIKNKSEDILVCIFTPRVSSTEHSETYFQATISRVALKNKIKPYHSPSLTIDGSLP